jgi:hypothetical protein
MRAKILVVIACLYFCSVSAQDAYICMPNGATGFAFNQSQKRWTQSNFRVTDEKKILKRINGLWQWEKFGEKFGSSTCGGDDFNKAGDFNSAGFIFCSLAGGHLRMSRNSLRYVETYELGFTNGKDEAGNTPFIEIGFCTPL